RGRGVEAQGPHRARQGVPRAQRHGRRGVLRQGGGRGQAARQGSARGVPVDAGPGAAVDVRPRVRRPASADDRGAGAVRRLPGLVRGGGEMTTLTLGKALNEGLRKAMENDPKVLVMGEDVGQLGGVFRITDGLMKDFGEERVIDTPLAESGIIGTAIGLALRGYRPVCEIQFDGFVFPAADQIITQLAKMRMRSLGAVSLPVVVRIPCGGGIGAVEHPSESPAAYFTHTAGLRVVACS